MRTVAEVYETYRIMPDLQLHQLRVAAVAKMVCGAFQKPIREQDVVLAALFHDMGNIAKFDLTRYPEFLEPKGLAYWERVKSETIEMYGADSHEASKEIAEEIGLSKTVVQLIDGVSVSKMPEIIQSKSYEWKVVEYSDDRVGPHGIVSVSERFDDMVERYAHRYKSPEEAAKQYETYKKQALMIEAQVLEHTSLTASDINDATVAPYIEELRKYVVA